MRKLPCFSLAEILITLGIIGVVAAMTIPIVLNNINNAQKSAGIKKAMNVLTNAYNSATQDNGGVSYACSYITSASTQTSECNAWWTSFKSKLNISKSCDYNAGANYFGTCLPQNGVDDLNVLGGCSGYRQSYQKTTSSIVLQDGTYLYIYGANNAYPLFAYDINGFRGPNKYGEDVFSFIIKDYKILSDSGCYTGDQAGDFLWGNK